MPTPHHLTRTTLTIHDGVVDIGQDAHRFVPSDRESVLRAYLLLVRRVRDQRRATTITLRRDDIEVLAAQLDETPEHVVDRLGELMGATRSQRTAMLTLFATGAMLIAASAPASAAAPPTPSGGFVPPLQPAVEHVIPNPPSAPAEPTTPSATPTRPSVTTAPPAPRGQRDHAGNGTGVSDDGSVVAVGLPPVPPDADRTEPPGTHRHQALTEDVPSIPTGVTDDGSIVAVGLPPVLPTTGVTDDGSTVAVGLPPVPPNAQG